MSEIPTLKQWNGRNLVNKGERRSRTGITATMNMEEVWNEAEFLLQKGDPHYMVSTTSQKAVEQTSRKFVFPAGRYTRLHTTQAAEWHIEVLYKTYSWGNPFFTFTISTAIIKKLIHTPSKIRKLQRKVPEQVCCNKKTPLNCIVITVEVCWHISYSTYPKKDRER